MSAKVTPVPTIKDLYGRTCEGPYFLVGGDKRQNVSAGLTVDAWNNTATQTMSGITIGATCGGKATATITCPNITVKDPNAMCEYQTTWCGGLTIEKVEALATVGARAQGTDNSNKNGGTINVSDGGNDNGGVGRCFYVTSIIILGNTSQALVNGKQVNPNDTQDDRKGKCGIDGQNGTDNWGLPSCNANNILSATEDSGYYVFFPAQKPNNIGYWQAQNIYMTGPGSLHANCK